uniref:Solute carrier organic anion transporter family member n=1 Tax=Rhipicephalus zambeziensis TaxID=60191 RepID=A0A224YX69_9ACAR
MARKNSLLLEAAPNANRVYGTQKQPWTIDRATSELPRSEAKTNGNAAPAAGRVPGGGADGELQEERDYMCGIGSCYPRILQRLATPRMFFIVYSIMGILQGAYKTYFVGTLSTIERRFAMSSQTTGIILIADNLSPIIINLLAGYYANRISRPKIMGMGALIVVLSCFISIVPYMIYGPGLHILSNTAHALGARKRSPDSLLCNSAMSGHRECTGPSMADSYTPFALFFAANFLNGFGASTFFIAGSSYMDDNIRKKNSPLYFGMGLAFRLLGPVVGFLTAGICLRFYEDPFHNPGISPKDPRWVGAWWMGYILFAVGLTVVSLPMMMFPRILPAGKNYKVNRMQRLSVVKANKAAKCAEGTGQHGISIAMIKDIIVIVKRLVRNPIFMFHTIGLVFVFLATAGFGTSFSKYVEFQFRQSASKANYYTGAAKVVTNIVGILVGGVVIHRFRPGPRVVAGYSAFVEVAMMAGFVAMMFIGCESPTIAGVAPGNNVSATSLLEKCNVDCNCNTQIYEPVCSSNKMMSYFSPCHAGCRSTGTSPMNVTIYKDCSCIAGGDHGVDVSYVTSGLCGDTCQKLGLFLGIVIAGQFLGSTGRVGGLLIFLRCVDPIDKSMAMGTTGSILHMLAFIPYPLIYGAILDHSCMIWEEKCGRRGNCWVYDPDKLRYTLHLVTIIFLAIAGVCYTFQFLLSGRIKRFYEDDLAEDSSSSDGQDQYESKATINEAFSVESIHKADEKPEATRF